MSRRTPVKELLKEEVSAPSSPLRRSTRLNTSSPVPTRVATRRNSSSDSTSTPKPTRGRRTSVTQDPDSGDDTKEKKPISARTRKNSESTEELSKEVASRTRGASATKEIPTEEAKTSKTPRRRKSASEDREIVDEPVTRVTRRRGSISKVSESAKVNGNESKESSPAKKSSEVLHITAESSEIDDTTEPLKQVTPSKLRRRNTEIVKVDLDLSVINEEETSPAKKAKMEESVRKSKSPVKSSLVVEITKMTATDIEKLTTNTQKETEHKEKEEEKEVRKSTTEEVAGKVDNQDLVEEKKQTHSVPEVSEKRGTPENLAQKDNVVMDETKEIENMEGSESPSVLEKNKMDETRPDSSVSDASFHLQLSPVLENSQNESDVSSKEKTTNKEQTEQNSDIEPMEVDESVNEGSPAKNEGNKLEEVAVTQQNESPQLKNTDKITEDIDSFLSEKIIEEPVQIHSNLLISPARPSPRKSLSARKSPSSENVNDVEPESHAAENVKDKEKTAVICNGFSGDQVKVDEDVSKQVDSPIKNDSKPKGNLEEPIQCQDKHEYNNSEAQPLDVGNESEIDFVDVIEDEESEEETNIQENVKKTPIKVSTLPTEETDSVYCISDEEISCSNRKETIREDSCTSSKSQVITIDTCTSNKSEVITITDVDTTNVDKSIIAEKSDKMMEHNMSPVSLNSSASSKIPRSISISDDEGSGNNLKKFSASLQDNSIESKNCTSEVVVIGDVETSNLKTIVEIKNDDEVLMVEPSLQSPRKSISNEIKLNISESATIEEVEIDEKSSHSKKASVERTSITLQEVLKGDDDSKRLSGRIHKVVDLFCAGLKNNSDVSINVSLEYAGHLSDAEEEDKKMDSINISCTATDIKEDQKGSKRRRIEYEDENESLNESRLSSKRNLSTSTPEKLSGSEKEECSNVAEKSNISVRSTLFKSSSEASLSSPAKKKRRSKGKNRSETGEPSLTAADELNKSANTSLKKREKPNTPMKKAEEKVEDNTSFRKNTKSESDASMTSSIHKSRSSSVISDRSTVEDEESEGIAKETSEESENDETQQHNSYSGLLYDTLEESDMNDSSWAPPELGESPNSEEDSDLDDMDEELEKLEEEVTSEIIKVPILEARTRVKSSTTSCSSSENISAEAPKVKEPTPTKNKTRVKTEPKTTEAVVENEEIEEKQKKSKTPRKRTHEKKDALISEEVDEETVTSPKHKSRKLFRLSKFNVSDVLSSNEFEEKKQKVLTKRNIEDNCTKPGDVKKGNFKKQDAFFTESLNTENIAPGMSELPKNSKKNKKQQNTVLGKIQGSSKKYDANNDPITPSRAEGKIGKRVPLKPSTNSSSGWKVSLIK